MYMAEMRTVTTLFVKLDSYSPEKHKNLLSLQVRFGTKSRAFSDMPRRYPSSTGAGFVFRCYSKCNVGRMCAASASQ